VAVVQLSGELLDHDGLEGADPHPLKRHGFQRAVRLISVCPSLQGERRITENLFMKRKKS
jgi:hypothetical protein